MDKTLFNQVGEVKGAASELEDSFSFQFTPQNENLKKTRGSLFTLVTVSGKTDERYEKAKSIYQQLQSSYYAKTSGSILHSLSETQDHLVKEVLSKEEEQGIKHSILSAVFWGSVLYLGKVGSGAVFVARGDKVKRLEFSKVASGVLESQDTICLAAEKFAEGVPTEELQEALNTEHFEKALENLDQKIGKIEGAVCVIVRLSVNAPAAKAEGLAIAEFNEKGEEVEAKPEKEEIPQEAVASEVQEPSEDKDTTLEEKISQEQEAVAEEKPEEAVPLRENDPFAHEEVKKPNRLTPIIAAATLYAKRAFNYLAKPWRKVPPGEEYDPVSRRKARIIQIVAAIIIILFLSLFFGFFNKRTATSENKASTAITSAENSLNEAESIKTSDPTQALTLVESANKDLEEAKKKDPNNPKIEELENKSSDLEAEINKTNNVSLTTLFDFSKLKKGAKLSDAAQLGNQILLVDQEQATLFSLEVTSKNGLEVSGSATSPQTITSFPSGYYLTNLNGIVKLDSAYKVSNVGSNANWGKIQSSATYQNNLYLLDPNKTQIWKYVATSQGLGSGKAYLTGEKPDLSTATAMAIDSFVWVVTKSGTIYKFAGGANQNFTTSGLSQPISQAADIFTNPATKNLYVLDTGSGRVVVLDKGGAYLAAYSNSSFKQASLLLVDESQKIAYVGVGEKLYSFKLP